MSAFTLPIPKHLDEMLKGVPKMQADIEAIKNLMEQLVELHGGKP